MSNAARAARLRDPGGPAHCRAMRALLGHARVFAIAAACGLAAYAVASLLVWASGRLGLLAWIAG
jgi:hypothetical protein